MNHTTLARGNETLRRVVDGQHNFYQILFAWWRGNLKKLITIWQNCYPKTVSFASIYLKWYRIANVVSIVSREHIFFRCERRLVVIRKKEFWGQSRSLYYREFMRCKAARIIKIAWPVAQMICPMVRLDNLIHLRDKK